MGKFDVIVVGAGLAGLACASELCGKGASVALLEATDRPGGRVKTDRHKGFLLDRGFQVYFEAYPQGQRFLDYDALDLHPFHPGALVRHGGRFRRFADPLRRPWDAPATLLNPIGTLADRFRMMELRSRACQGPMQSVFDQPEMSTLERLREEGFSPSMIRSFFQPLLGGIFLDSKLETSSRILDFVLRMMTQGRTCVPAKGMEEIPRQMAGRLPEGVLRCETPVEKVEPGKVRLAGRKVLKANHVVLAVEGPAAYRLSGGRIPDPGSRPVTCLYFSAPRAPVTGPWLVLNGEGRGPINNLAVMSEVAPVYAPPGHHLISISVLRRKWKGVALRNAVLRQARAWFGASVDRWEHLRTYDIAHAQPLQCTGFREDRMVPPPVEPGLLAAGDYRDTASINGALYSGRRVAEYLAGRDAIAGHRDD